MSQKPDYVIVNYAIRQYITDRPGPYPVGWQRVVYSWEAIHTLVYEPFPEGFPPYAAEYMV